MRAPTTVNAMPGSVLTISARYDNTGFAATHGLTLTAMLDPALKYLGSTGSITPTVQGNTLTWQLRDLGFLSNGTVQVQVQAPAASPGTSYPVSFTLDAPGDKTPNDNTATVQVTVTRQFFLPLINQ